MTRDMSRLRTGGFDVLVVGGGIHGLFAAYDAAARGLSVALVERGDIGSGISFNHQRTIHGGLRALQGGHLAKCREQIAERRAWARIAPHLVRPLPFLIGTYRGTRRSRTAVRLGFKLYDFIGRKRNAGVLPELHLPNGRLESAAATRRLAQGISEAGLSGGAIWYDYQTTHPDRLTWTVALAAERAGALLCTYTEALAPLIEAGRITGLTLRDTLTPSSEPFTVRAATVVLAAGAGTPHLAGLCGLPSAPPLVRAMNLLLDRPAKDIAVASPSARGRMLTSVPWRGKVLVGTFQSDGPVSPDDGTPPAGLVDECLAEVATAFPALAATKKDVLFIHMGLVPGQQTARGWDLLPEPQVVVPSPATGVIGIIGVKYTTARLTAARAVDAAARELGKPTQPCRTDRTLLPYADVADTEGMLEETCRALHLTLERECRVHLAEWYGTEAPAVLRCAHESNAVVRLSLASPVLEGEILYAARQAGALRLEDAVFRRTPLCSAGALPGTALERAADIMAEALAWSPERRDEELARVNARLAV